MKSNNNYRHTSLITALSLIFLNIIPISSYVILNTIRNKRNNHHASTSANLKLQMSSSSSDTYVMVNGMPGPMAVAAAEACVRKGLKLCPIALTGPDVKSNTLTVTDEDTNKSTGVRLIPSNDNADIESALESFRTDMNNNANIVAIDFTHPSAVNTNGLWYIKNNVPFVMGTTGGDREKLMKDVTDAKLFAVIAPNMAKQIVAMQMALEDLADRFPTSFDGYKLSVTESHQKTKADTSGTAKAVIESLKTLSNDSTFSIDNDIDMLRDDTDSLDFGVPKEGLNGHAFHTYTLQSSDGSVTFELKHNVVGRRVYAEGTADAIIFLINKIKNEKEGKVYSMINVLEEGAME